MRLADMLAAHDDAALEALASKGLVRRARRDLEAGGATISERTESGATVIAEEQTVRVDARGLTASRCTCPAGGTCRHLLLAVMVLREQAPHSAPETSDGGDADARNAVTAAAEICSLSQNELAKFAGNDWAAAVTLADTSSDATVVESELSCTVEFSGQSVAVTFIQGQGLKGAAYKGPKRRARVVVAAAAILVRMRRGISIESDAMESATIDAPLTSEFLHEAGETLFRATRIVMTGPSALAVDMLFDLAISSRAEAAPRLAAQCRMLARHAGLALARDVHFEPESFFVEAARACALVEALRRDPQNDALTGSLRRTYEPAASLDLWMLGASVWRSETGARGLSFFAFAPETRHWHTTTFARAAGQDPTFEPRSAYQLPLWGSEQGRKLMGRCVKLPAPLIAHDGSIAPTLPQTASAMGSVGDVRTLVDAGAAFQSWSALLNDLAARFGHGLKRRGLPLPALLAPAKFGALSFDELGQVYELDAIDQAGDVIKLTMPASDETLAERLRREGRQIRLMLSEASLGQGRLILRPITIAIERGGELEFINLGLDQWPRPSKVQATLDAVQNFVTASSAPTVASCDGLRGVLDRAVTVATLVAAGEKSREVEYLGRTAEAAGLTILAREAERLSAKPNLIAALRLAYLAAEGQATLAPLFEYGFLSRS